MKYEILDKLLSNNNFNRPAIYSKEVAESPIHAHDQLTLAQIRLLRQAAANATSRRVVDRIVRRNLLLRNKATDKRKSDFTTEYTDISTLFHST